MKSVPQVYLDTLTRHLLTPAGHVHPLEVPALTWALSSHGHVSGSLASEPAVQQRPVLRGVSRYT